MKESEDISFLLPIREFSDKGTKWLLEFAENVKGLLSIVASNLVDSLDFSRLEQVNQTFIPDNLRKQESDVVYLVPFRSKDVGEVMIYVLIEHQSTPSHVMGFRVLFYMVQIWDAQRRAWEDNKVPESQWRFRPVIPIVLYTGSRKWEVPIKIDVLMNLPEELRRFVPTFETLFLNVKGTEESDLLKSNHPFSWLLAVIRKEHTDKVEFTDVLIRAIENISQLPEKALNQWTRAMYYLVLLIYHGRPIDEHEELQDIVSQNIKGRKREKEGEEMAQTIVEYYIEQGEKQGELRGEKRGELRAKREVVLKLMRFRFDAVPESVEKKVKSTRSINRLDALFEKALSAKNISELKMDGNGGTP